MEPTRDKKGPINNLPKYTWFGTLSELQESIKTRSEEKKRKMKCFQLKSNQPNTKRTEELEEHSPNSH